MPWFLLTCKCHFTSVYKKFIYWTNNKVFFNFYNSNLNLYIKTRLLNKNYFNNIYIDSTHIKNIKGEDVIGSNHYDRYRNSTKYHVIVDENKIPLSYKFTAGNVHDVNTTMSLAEPLININMDKRRVLTLIADKGYISKNNKEKLEANNINLVYPLKKNNINNINNNKNKNILKSRYLVEYHFNDIDKYRRLILRYERKISIVESLHLLAFSKLIINKLQD